MWLKRAGVFLIDLDAMWSTVGHIHPAEGVDTLLALEEGHLPTEIEPGTLKRTGYCDYNGAIKGPFTAHPKIDPVTGEMVFFGYNAAGPLTPALSFGSVTAPGVVKVWLKVSPLFSPPGLPDLNSGPGPPAFVTS